MNLIVTIDHRFAHTPDGAMWTMTSFTYPFWKRYLAVFDHVRVVARVQDVPSAAPNWTRCDGEGVSFAAIPYYHGPWQYLRRARQVRRAVRNAVGADDAVILRVQGQISSCLRPFLRQTGRPYGVEVVGDPYDAFAPGYVTHPLRPFLRWWLPRRMREQCAGACAAAYVTEHALQRRYPPAPGAFSTHYSSIVLPDAALASAARPLQAQQRTFTLIIVGTLDNLSKGPDVLIDARVRFTGWLPAGEAVRAQLDQADLFVLPSRQEGLSRSTIEAMARALPCIATTVGGTSELLPPEDLVPPNDVPALVHKIREVVTDPERMARMSARNLKKANEFREEVLSKRWTAFYRYVREKTEEWLKTNKEGVCNYCRGSIRSLLHRNEEDLQRILARFRHKGKYDCIVALSGGRDSTFVTYYAVEELGLNVLAVTCDNGFMPEQTKINVANTVERLGIDHIYLRYDHVKDRAKDFISSWVRKPSPAMIAFLCSGCMTGIREYLTKAAYDNNVSLILGGGGGVVGYGGEPEQSFAEKLLSISDSNSRVGRPLSLAAGFLLQLVKNPSYFQPMIITCRGNS